MFCRHRASAGRAALSGHVVSRQASFSRIAKHAGLSSTGMISYHFAGKDDLLAACVAEIEKVNLREAGTPTRACAG